MSKADGDYQNFVAGVSVYSQQQGVVLATQAFEHKTTSELKVVLSIAWGITSTRGGINTGCLALSKKTIQLIVENGNDYVITVKGNQPKLFQHLQALAAENQPVQRFTDVEKVRNRVTCRIINVFDDISSIDCDS